MLDGAFVSPTRLHEEKKIKKSNMVGRLLGELDD